MNFTLSFILFYLSLDIVIYSGMLWKPNWKVFILCIEHFYVLLECVIQIDDMNVVMYFYDECAFCIINIMYTKNRDVMHEPLGLKFEQKKVAIMNL